MQQVQMLAGERLQAGGDDVVVAAEVIEQQGAGGDHHHGGKDQLDGLDGGQGFHRIPPRRT
ncbi:MAG: hypothetical protein HC925_06050 [Coleofasciculaceae cyanobacterium SM2_3_26]|nr:hypothetical protein [Coleofasciculaceae cyanobacterium SM2_3_26]